MKKISCLLCVVFVFLFFCSGSGYANEKSDAELLEITKTLAEQGYPVNAGANPQLFAAGWL